MAATQTLTLPMADGLALRPWSLAKTHVAAVLVAAVDPDIRHYNSVGLVNDREGAEEWLTRRSTEPDRLDWAISSGSEVLGRASLAHIDPVDGVAEIGYWLLSPHRGRGIASEAVATVERHAFDTVGLGRLVIRHEPDNIRSCLLARRRGFLVEGTARGAFERRGQRRDLHVHARLASDPPPS